MSNTVFKRTKILATVGPATHSPEKIQAIMEAGVNGFRINFSHGGEPDRLEQISWIRESSEKLGKPVAILQDLQGPKIRLGILKDNMLNVKHGDILTLDSSLKEHDGGMTLPVQFNLAEKMKVGEPLYMFDGKIRSVVTEIPSSTAVRVEIQNDGFLMSRKGLNLPDTDFGGDILSQKDIEDLEWGAGQDFDYVALSFVQTAGDIIDLRARLAALGSNAHIVSKIETKSAIRPENLEEIIRVSDGVMVARGDLAVEAGAEVVPVVQRRIIALCRKHGKLGIVATQMMGSMVDNPEPTRAEISDVANAVIQGADTVMLSDETANGKYPVETVKAMRSAIMYTQEHSEVMAVDKGEARQRTDAAISYSAVRLAQDINAQAIIAETSSGATAVNIAAFRPNLPIISVTDHQTTAQKLALNYATRSYVRPSGFESAGKLAEELKAEGYFSGEPVTVVLVSGHSPGKPGTTNNIQVRVI
ncbi:pyruvate kinase [Candidatus Saccharibacteria bacterium 32-49-12]|nr:MAG: pyruvate kinase [Candidatus Saccharibacteria bacterium 32-49-12]